MSLDLASMAADVEAIADKAAKETHQETALSVMQGTWDRVEFWVTAAKETDTPLVKMSEEDLEVTGISSWHSGPRWIFAIASPVLILQR